VLVNRVGDDLIEDLEEGWVVGHTPLDKLLTVMQVVILLLRLDRTTVHARSKQDVVDVAELTILFFDGLHGVSIIPLYYRFYTGWLVDALNEAT